MKILKTKTKRTQKQKKENFVAFDFGNLMFAVYKWVRVTLLTVAAE